MLHIATYKSTSRVSQRAERSFLEREASERATISQVINSRHSSFLTVNQETKTSQSPGWATQTIFSLSPEAKSFAVRLLYAVSLLSPSLLTQYLFSACAIQPYKRLMGMCRLMGSHFHDWIDYNGIAFSKELLEWGRTFSDFWGQRVVRIMVSKRTRIFVLQVKSKVFFIQFIKKCVVNANAETSRFHSFKGLFQIGKVHCQRYTRNLNPTN